MTENVAAGLHGKGRGYYELYRRGAGFAAKGFYGWLTGPIYLTRGILTPFGGIPGSPETKMRC